MTDVPSLDAIAHRILSTTPEPFRFLVPESLSFNYEVLHENMQREVVSYFAAISGNLTRIRQAPFEVEPIDHLHAKSLPFACEQMAYVLAAKLILEKRIPGLEHMSLDNIVREKKEILRAAKLTYAFSDIPLTDTTILSGWVGLLDKPYSPGIDRPYSGRMDISLADKSNLANATKATYHVVRMHK